MQKQYNSKETEKKYTDFWIKNKIYKFNKTSKKPVFSIDTPPPTVSGKLHMGHTGSMSQMDFIARYQRMKGKNVFYPIGTDDNGIPTERLVEKINKVKARNMKRNDFIKLCLKTLIPIRKDYLNDFKKLGLSFDWDIFYSTIDKHSQKISQQSFIDLYKQKREYRKQAPVIWCPQCQTAIAQVELEDRELTSHFNDIIFKIQGNDYIISTTRPELLPACVAIFVHPTDQRYKKLIGKQAEVPIFRFKVPIKKDERVDPEKGTGMMMVCTFGDMTDAELYMQYNLPLKIAITKYGTMTDIAGPYKGLKIRDAREQILHDLKKQNLLISQREITHPVNTHDKCGTEVEILETKQWFIKYLDLKQKFLKEGKKLNWYPKFMFNRYQNWIKGLQWDWCISRQRYFGVPFPVWYCKKCDEVILAKESQLPVDPLTTKPPVKQCPKCKSKEFIPEKDIIDTWATSSLTPDLAIKLLPKKYRKKLFPMSLRPQAHDIITFWLFNTLVKSQLHYKTNPWKDVMISGFILDPKGKKMSKSKGNIIEPQKMMEKYSADALRFWAASTKLGDDSPFQEKELVAGKKFINKLWNASKFTFMHLKDYKHTKPKKLEQIDKWILSELTKVTKLSTENFNNYKYSITKQEVENFFWKKFCDNYLEIIKNRLYNPKNKNEKKSAQYTLYTSLLTILKLMAPITPYITEEIYQNFFKKQEKEKSIHITRWPKLNYNYKASEKLAKTFLEILAKVRQNKNKNNKPLNTEIILTLSPTDYKIIHPAIEDLKSVTKATEIKKGKFNISF